MCVELSAGSAPSLSPYLADWLALTAIETGFLSAVEAHSAWALPSVSIKGIKEDRERERKCEKIQTSTGEYTSVAPFWSSLHLFGETMHGFVYQGRNRLHVIEGNKEASYTRATLILQLSEVVPAGKSRLCQLNLP